MSRQDETSKGIEVIILAGGLGTRLRSVLPELPKPMAPVKNKPFLEHLMLWLAGYNIRKYILSVGYQATKITSYFSNKFNNVPVVYSFEPYPLGTGGGIIQALNLAATENVLVVNGDTYFPINITDLFQGHLISGSPVTIALKKMKDFDRYGTVIVNERGIVKQFEEVKFREEGLINGGIYFINQEYLKTLKLPSLFSFEKIILGKEALGKTNSMVFDDPFIDIGIPEDYFKAEQIL